MSVLVAARNLRSEALVGRVDLSDAGGSASHNEALVAWGQTTSGWNAVAAWDGRLWDELVNEAIAGPHGRSVLVRALVELAKNCEQLAIWYAGFPDDVPVVESVEELERVLDEQVSAGDLEPAIRFVSVRANP